MELKQCIVSISLLKYRQLLQFVNTDTSLAESPKCLEMNNSVQVVIFAVKWKNLTSPKYSIILV